MTDAQKQVLRDLLDKEPHEMSALQSGVLLQLLGKWVLEIGARVVGIHS